jgi:hypothetical protein
MSLLIKILSYILSGLFLLLFLPFGIVYVLLKSFWKVFGATVIAFIIIGLFGGTLEECIRYSTSLGFFVGVGLHFVERKK